MPEAKPKVNAKMVSRKWLKSIGCGRIFRCAN